MKRQFTATVHPSITLGDAELNLIAEIRFTHIPAYKGRGPSYSDGGLPPEPEGVEDKEVISLTIDGDSKTTLTTAPTWLAEWITENANEDELLDAVDYGPDPDEMRERMRDDDR